VVGLTTFLICGTIMFMKIVHLGKANEEFYNICVKLDEHLSTSVPGRNEAGVNSLYNMENIKDIFLLYDGDRVIGSTALWYHDKESCEIIRVFVDDEYRGKGLVKLLLEQAELHAIKMGYYKIFLRTWITTPYAIRAYEKLGFRHIEPERFRYRDKFQKALVLSNLRVYMRKDLQPTKDIWFIFEPDTDQKEFILAAAERRGLRYNVVEYEAFSYNGDELLYYGEPIKVFPKIALNRVSSSWDLRYYPIMERNGVRMINNYRATQNCNDKLLTCRIIEKLDIRQPKTVFFDKDISYQRISRELGNTFVAKHRFGFSGNNVHLVNNEKQFEKAMKKQTRTDYIFQEYIEGFTGRDIRIYMVDEKYVGAMMRINDNDFRSNIGQGGHAVKCMASKEQIKDVQKIVKAIGGEITSVDFLVNAVGELLFCEANANACVEPYENMGYPISDDIIQYLVTCYEETEE